MVKKKILGLIMSVQGLDLIVKLGEEKSKCSRPFIDQSEFETSKRGKISDSYNLHSCCKFKMSNFRNTDERCFGSSVRTFSFNERKAECMPVNIRALCEDESKFSKLNLFRSRNKCETACLEEQLGGLEAKREPTVNEGPRAPSIFDRLPNGRQNIQNELGISRVGASEMSTSNEMAPSFGGGFGGFDRPSKPFNPFMMTRGVGYNPNRNDIDDYIRKYKNSDYIRRLPSVQDENSNHRAEMRSDFPLNKNESDAFKKATESEEVEEEMAKGRPKLCRKRMKEGKSSNKSNSSTIKWYYDKKKNNCFEFFFKGKGGNGNQFDTASSCLRKCQIQKEEKEHTARSFRFESGEYGPRDMVPVDICQREPPSSFCKTNSAAPMYYFNSRSGSCEVFLAPCDDSSCDSGTCNRFSSLANCEFYCGRN